MKKVLILAALVLGMASCQKDFAVENESRGEVSVQLAVAAPELIGATRTDGDAQNKLNSAYGAIDYLDGNATGDRQNWSKVDLRYSLEVYDEADPTTPVKDRMVVIKDKYEPVNFELRLIPNRDYRFVVFADFVPEGEAAKTVDYSVQGELGLRHTIGANLTEITIKQDVDDINDELADAYFKAFTYTPTNSGSNKADDVILQRPYAKVRVVATDLADLNLNVEPKYVYVDYGTSYIPTTFNAVTGEIGVDKNSSDKAFDGTYVEKIRTNRVNHVYNVGYDALTSTADNGVERASHLTLFTDYILATGTQAPISFQMTVCDENNDPIKTVNFNTNIPVQRNHLTTIIGNVLTDATEVTVTIDDDFANAGKVEEEPWYIEIWDGKSQTEPEIVTDSTTGEPVAVVDQPSDLAWLAAFVNGTLETPSTFATRASNEAINIVLAADIDLGNMPWTPIGSATAEHGYMGNFDGNGKTIKNLCIANVALDADNYAYAGLFGITEGTPENHNWIKNLTIENVNISTEGHIVAAAVAYPYYTDIENVTVKGNVSIKGGNYTSGVLAYTRRCVNVANIAVEANEGSKIEGNITVGGVISDIQMNGGLTANYSNFAASGVTIKGVKNVGGISGIISKQTLNGATVKNVNIVCDEESKGIVSGSLGDKSTIENVVYENVTGATRIIGTTYGDGAIVVANANDLIAALEDGKDVYLFNNITIDPANMSNAYGKTGINVKNGQTIDGAGYTLNINGAGGTWDSGIATTGGLIKNLTVTGSFRGIFIKSGNYTEKVVLQNVTITGTTYTISCDQGKYQGIEATNCTFNGWTSFAKTAGEAKFTNCYFGEGNGYKYCRPYSNTEFVDCTFCPGYTVDTTRATVTFTDCTWEE